MKSVHNESSHIVNGAILVLLIGLPSLITIHWLHVDSLLGPDTDSKIYFVNTVRFLDIISTQGWDRLSESLRSLSLSGRPPLYQLLSLPFLLIFDRSMDSASMVNMLFQALLVMSVFQIGKLSSNTRTGLLAALLVSIYPPLVQLARVYRPHFALAACVCFALWRLIALHRVRSATNMWLFMLSIVFGLFIHPTFVFVLWLPALLGTFYILFFQLEPRLPARPGNFAAWLKAKLADPILLRAFLPTLLLAILLVLGWYASIGTTLLDLLRTISSANLADYRGYDVFTKGLRPAGISYYWWYLWTMPKAISLVFTGSFLWGLGYILWKRKWTSLLLVITFLGAYLSFANLTTMTWMHFAQVLPVVALISATWAGELRHRALAILSSTALIAVGIFVYAYVTWGGDSIAPAAAALGAPIGAEGACLSSDQVFCARPPSQDDWKISEILDVISKDPACEPQSCDVLVLNGSNNFTGSTFLYYRATELPKSDLIVPAWRDNNFRATPFDFEMFLKSPFIVYVWTKYPGRSYTGAALRLVQNPPRSFALSHNLLAEFDLPGGRKAHLLKRTAPLSLTEAQEVIHAIDLDEKYMSGQFRLLAPLFAQAGDPDGALRAYRKALEYEPGDSSLYFALAVAYEALGQVEDAADAYRQLVAMAPGSDLAIHAQAWLDAH